MCRFWTRGICWLICWPFDDLYSVGALKIRDLKCKTWNTNMKDHTCFAFEIGCPLCCTLDSVCLCQGDHSFSTMIFDNFSMTYPWPKMNFHDLLAQHISSKYTIHDLWMLTRIKIFSVALRNYCDHSFSTMIFTETKILVHFYKKIPGHHHHFPWLSMTFHDLGCFPWLSRPRKWPY